MTSCGCAHPAGTPDAVFSSLIGGEGVYAVTPVGQVRLGRLLRGRQPDLAQPLDHRGRHHRVPRGARLPRRRPARAVMLRADRRPRRTRGGRGRPGSARRVRPARPALDCTTTTPALDRPDRRPAPALVRRCRRRQVQRARRGPTGWPMQPDRARRADARSRARAIDRPLRGAPADPAGSGTATQRNGGHARCRRSTACTATRDARHAYAVLRGLTSSGGGMVAAATTSLPERAEQGRNYDYRYAWIRDQCYAGQAAAAAGAHAAARRRRARSSRDRLHADGAKLAPAYTVDGGRVPDQRELDLPGYPGGFDLVGQLGEQAVSARRPRRGAAAVRRRGPAATGSTPTAWRAAEIAADAIAQRWQRARRRDLGDRRPALDAQPADLRGRAARRGPGHQLRRRGRGLVRAGRRDPGRRPRPTARASDRPLAALTRRRGPRRRAAAPADPRRAARRRSPHASRRCAPSSPS